MRLVFVSDWQMQCCGDPFSVGDEIDWTVAGVDRPYLTSVLGKRLAAEITDHEEHHNEDDDPVQPLVGRVCSISAVWCTYELRSQTYVPLAGATRLEDRVAVDGWEAAYEPEQFVGYIVNIDDA